MGDKREGEYVMDFVPLIIISIVVESAVETFNTIVKANGKISYKKIGAIILSVAICMCVPFDLFEAVGMDMTCPYIGEFVTGLVVSRGGGVVNSLIERLVTAGAKEPNKVIQKTDEEA